VPQNAKPGSAPRSTVKWKSQKAGRVANTSHSTQTKLASHRRRRPHSQHRQDPISLRRDPRVSKRKLDRRQDHPIRPRRMREKRRELRLRPQRTQLRHQLGKKRRHRHRQLAFPGGRRATLFLAQNQARFSSRRTPTFTRSPCRAAPLKRRRAAHTHSREQLSSPIRPTQFIFRSHRPQPRGFQRLRPYSSGPRRCPGIAGRQRRRTSQRSSLDETPSPATKPGPIGSPKGRRPFAPPTSSADQAHLGSPSRRQVVTFIVLLSSPNETISLTIGANPGDNLLVLVYALLKALEGVYPDSGFWRVRATGTEVPLSKVLSKLLIVLAMS